MASPLYTMRALANPGPGYVTWQYGYPDYAGTYAPSPILAGTAVIVSGPVPLESLGKLDTTHAPAGLWLFENNLNDSSGNGFNLTGAPNYTTVARDNQLGALYAATPWTRPSRDAALAIIGALTVEAVVTISTAAAGGSICSVSNGGETEADNTAFWCIASFPTGEMAMFWESGVGVNRVVTSPGGVLPVGTPCHLAYTRSADAVAVVNFYVNGINVGSGSAIAATGATAANLILRVASDGGGTNQLGRGSILTSLKIIAAELTPAQIVAEYNRVLGGRGIVYPRL